MTSNTQGNYNPKGLNSKPTATIRFTEHTEIGRLALTVYQEFSVRPDPFRPCKQMSDQAILTQALIALGEKDGMLTEGTLAEQTPALVQAQPQAPDLSPIMAALERISDQILHLAGRGTITVDQAKAISDVLDDETKRFAQAQAKTLKGGKRS